MKTKSIGLIILMILVVILEFLFGASHVPLLVNLRLIYVYSLLLFEQKKSGVGIFFLLTGSAAIEFLSFQQIIGISAMAMFLSIAFASALYKFITFPGPESSYAKLMLILVGAILLKHIIYTITGFAIIFDFYALIINLVIMFVGITIWQSLRHPQNALRT